MGVADDKLEMLFIDPEQRSKGIGKKLLNFAINQLGVKKVDVNEENRQAVGFYLHMGFRVVGRSELDATGKSHPILSMELITKKLHP
ncbi:GNAT family N-acetyltransferase [bacterium BFN5]|nr:GNAT family N-acetyltransferase [bacterium BFN5]